MNHHNKNRKFNRDRNQRKALLYALANNLITKEKIKTTEAKAKELRPFIERIITKSKIDTVSSRRFVDSKLFNNKKAVEKLFNKIGPKYKEVAGGYTRIIKLNPRKSDGALMAYIEFV